MNHEENQSRGEGRVRKKRQLHGRGRPPRVGRKIVTGREQKVANLLIEGLSNKGIAERMEISVPLVKKLLRRVFAKLGVSTRYAAIAILLRGGRGK